VYARLQSFAILVRKDGEPVLQRIAGTAENPGRLEYDGPVAVALRTTRSWIESQGLLPLPDADVMFPMVVRGELVGTISCTIHKDPESGKRDELSREEREALLFLAREIGLAVAGWNRSRLSRASCAGSANVSAACP
jgi:hypothetical protein